MGKRSGAKRLSRGMVRSVLFGLVLVANPAYATACSGGDESDEFSFGEAEMLELLDAVNTTESWGFESYALSLDLEQQAGAVTARAEGIVRSAHACGNRTFVKSAAACIDITELPVEGTVTVVALNDDGNHRARCHSPGAGKHRGDWARPGMGGSVAVLR